MSPEQVAMARRDLEHARRESQGAAALLRWTNEYADALLEKRERELAYWTSLAVEAHDALKSDDATRHEKAALALGRLRESLVHGWKASR